MIALRFLAGALAAWVTTVAVALHRLHAGCYPCPPCDHDDRSPE
jgi:hypothetical protein